MNEREMQAFRGENIKVIGVDGQEISGFCSVFTRALDNEPEIASLVVETKDGLIEVYQNEIKTIEIIQ